MTATTDRVEQTAIQAARSYAAANHLQDDPLAIGLVLAGMVVGALATPEAQRELTTGYLDQHPESRDAIEGWAEVLSESGTA